MVEDRIILVFAVLGVAVLSDLWKRQVPDLLWVAGGAGAVLLYMYDPWELENLHGLVIIPFAILLWRKGVFGGADAFALLFISLILPMFSYADMRMTPFTILVNSGIMIVPWIVLNVIRNYSYLRRTGSLFTDESIIQKIRKLTLAHISNNSKNSYEFESTRYKRVHQEQHSKQINNDTWVTPAIPYLLFITAGFAFQIFYGDMILRLFI